MTKRQQDIIDAIRKIGDKPVQNISVILGELTHMAPANVSNKLKKLEELGIIKRRFPFVINEERIKEYEIELKQEEKERQEYKQFILKRKEQSKIDNNKNKPLTQEKIAKIVGLSRQTVNGYLKKGYILKGRKLIKS